MSVVAIDARSGHRPGPCRVRQMAAQHVRHLIGLTLALLVVGAGAQPAPVGHVQPTVAPLSEHEVDTWLLRLHQASRQRNFIGTFVVSSASGALASARIWHACEGERQIERVETLTGAPRSIFRHNDQVVTFLPDQKVARTERRESLGAFPGLLKSLDTTITDFYSAQPAGHARVAGFDAEVMQLSPKDSLRFGYKVWSEQQSGLVLKVQTLDVDGGVLEQAAFSELQLDAPVQIDKLAQMMAATDGWNIESPQLVKTTPEAAGWALPAGVPGFQPVHCYQRALARPNAAPPDDRSARALHWVFSDGLASVSLFIEPHDAKWHPAPGHMAMGATHTLTRRIAGSEADADNLTSGDWWLTAVGEVPLSTLRMFGHGLRRVEPRQ